MGKLEEGNIILSVKHPFTNGYGLVPSLVTVFTLAAFYTEPPVTRATMSVTRKSNTVRDAKICPRMEVLRAVRKSLQRAKTPTVMSPFTLSGRGNCEQHIISRRICLSSVVGSTKVIGLLLQTMIRSLTMFVRVVGGRTLINHNLSIIAIACFLLAGCCQDNYKPLADTDYSKEQYTLDLKQCKNQAFYATRNPNEGSGALVGGAMGGIVGGLIGGAVGAGAAGGGAISGSNGTSSKDAYYNLIQKCMEDRGYEGTSTCDIR